MATFVPAAVENSSPYSPEPAVDTLPLFFSITEWCSPNAMETTPLVTVVGTYRSSVLPLWSWLYVLSPQVYSTPLSSTAPEELPPANTELTFLMEALSKELNVDESSSSPS